MATDKILEPIHKAWAMQASPEAWEEIERLRKQAAAARAMLTALKAAHRALPLTGASTELRMITAAIAQAEAAGLTAADPCQTCGGLGANPTTGEDCGPCFGGGDKVEE